MVRFLPPQANVDHLKNEAKALLKSHKGKDAQVCPVLRNLRRFKDADERQILSTGVTLTEVQFALAMEYGFRNWNELREAVLSLQPVSGYQAGAGSDALVLPDPPVGKSGCNRYASAYSMALSYCGAPADYDTVAGDSGLAFIFQADSQHKPWDTNVKQLDIGYWPLAQWGSLLRLDFLGQVYGIPLRQLPLDEGEYRADQAAHYRTYYEREVLRCLQAGRPAVAFEEAAWVVVGCDGGNPPLLGQVSCSDAAQVQRLQHYPWTVVVLDEPTKPMSRLQADKEALEFAVRLGQDDLRKDLPGKSSGRASFELWQQQLRDAELCGPHFYHANVVINLRWNRSAAVQYLRQMAERQGKAATALRSAADCYDGVLATLANADTSKESLSTSAGREKLAALAGEIADLEADARAHMGECLLEMR